MSDDTARHVDDPEYLEALLDMVPVKRCICDIKGFHVGPNELIGTFDMDVLGKQYECHACGEEYYSTDVPGEHYQDWKQTEFIDVDERSPF